MNRMEALKRKKESIKWTGRVDTKDHERNDVANGKEAFNEREEVTSSEKSF